jgi:hypothetical protein
MWKDIPGYEGKYQACEDGRIRNATTMCELKPRPDRNGYLDVGLNRVRKRVHRLVAETFILHDVSKNVVNHKDGNKLNNHIDNLEWCTSQINNQHAYDTGLHGKGEDHVNSKLTEEQVIEIKRLGRYDTARNIGKKYNVSKGTINDIFEERTWKDVG